MVPRCRQTMVLRTQNRSLCAVAAFTVFGIAVAAGQTLDTSGDGLLNGKFQFRHVAILNVDIDANPTEIQATYGTITFDGAGNYTITGTTINNTISSGAPQPLTVTGGTYAIGANGAGYVANLLYPTNQNAYVYGAVAQGVYSGSSTEVGGELTLNDIFIAIPVGEAPTNAGFTSPYQTGLLDFTGAGSTAILNALFDLAPNGQGGFGAINLNGQASNQSASTIQQSVSGATYNFNSDGSATLTIPLPPGVSSTNALFTGTKTMFQSADSNFILGWTGGGYDIFFGIKALTTAGTNSISQGLYFTAALEDSPTSSGTDSYYGGTNNFGDSKGDGVIHQRLNAPDELSYDFGTDDQIGLNADGSAGPDLNGYDYLFGDGGLAFVAMGTNGNFSLLVGMRAAVFSGPGVYLNPIGVVNAASYQPITASLAPGEVITLFGTDLSPVTQAVSGGQPFLPSLGGVSVSIDGIPCPIYFVSPTQISVIAPYELASNQSGLANIQVINGQDPSNVVQMYLTDAAPGVFSLETTPPLVTISGEPSMDGIGYAAALHAATGAPVTPDNPAEPGEYISVFLTGLGTVTPTISDGVTGPLNPLSWAEVYQVGNLTVLFNDFKIGSTGNVGNIEYAGLAPGLAGLYQLNVQVPEGVLGAGDDVYLEFVTDAADNDQIQIPYGSSGGVDSDRVDLADARVRARLAGVRLRRLLRGKTAAQRANRRGGPSNAVN
jgi:uncharacterized protein (TIGR03437 family)